MKVFEAVDYKKTPKPEPPMVDIAPWSGFEAPYDRAFFQTRPLAAAWNPENGYFATADDWRFFDAGGDYPHTTHGVPLVSPQLRTALESAGINRDFPEAEFLPVTIYEKAGPRNLEGRYFALNIVAPRLDAVDPEKSKYVGPRRDNGANLYRATLRGDVVAGHNVFRCVEGYAEWYVSEAVAKVFKKFKAAISLREVQLV
jgi:hypothetical protein